MDVKEIFPDSTQVPFVEANSSSQLICGWKTALSFSVSVSAYSHARTVSIR